MLKHNSSFTYIQRITPSVVTKRNITISQSPTVTYSPNSSINTQGNVISNNNISETVHQLPDLIPEGSDPLFQSIGTPQSTLSLSLPPSSPVYIKRGSLISLFGAKDITNSISSTLEVHSPLRRLLFGNITSSYQKLMSTVPIKALVSAYDQGSFGILSFLTKGTASTLTFVNLSLDGRVDWAIFPPKGLHCYAGSSLIVSPRAFPRNSKNGMFSWLRSGYTLCSGRGYLSLIGEGQVFKLSLGPDEEILIKKDSLLASSVNGVDDFKNGYFEMENLNQKIDEESKLNQKTDQDSDESLKPWINPDESTPKSSIISTTYNYTKRFIQNIVSIFKSSSNNIHDNIIGNGSFLKIKGPRSILLQTKSGMEKVTIGSNTNSFSSLSNQVSNVEKYIKKAEDFKNPQTKPADFLSYVSVKDGKVEFKSTPDFSKTVKEIESLKKE